MLTVWNSFFIEIGAIVFVPKGGVKQEIPLVGYRPPQHPVMADRLAKQFGVFLRKRRGDLTFQQFSRKTGISDSTLQRAELGLQNITLRTLEQVCDRLKCKVSDIFQD
jgi:DNA-binding Xre family transcriptional regulator